MFDYQKVFNFVAKNVITQGERSAIYTISDNGNEYFSHCAYRGKGEKSVLLDF